MIGLSQVAAVVVRSGVNARPDQPLPPPADAGRGEKCDGCGHNHTTERWPLCICPCQWLAPAPTTEGGE